MKVFELLIILFIVAILGLVVRGCTVDPEGAEAAARDYAVSMGIHDPKVACTARDSDGDGYISCTIGQTKPDGTIVVSAVECAAGVFSFWNEGCRVPKLRGL